MKYLILLLIPAFIFIQCGSKSVPTAQEGNYSFFGEKIDEADAVSLTKAISQLGDQDSVRVKIKGTVESVCKVKGCWMNVVEDGQNEEIFVRFKDYGFFMPLDCEGQEVVFDGYAMREVVTVDELRHYAEDEGKSEEEIASITEPEETLRFMAHGVILEDKKNQQ